MKKVTLILSAFALVLGLSQCKKQETPAQSGEKQHIVLTASNGNGGSKVAVEIATAVMNLTWETDDVITVSGGADGMLTLKSGAGDDYATFEGDITIDEGGEIVFTVGSEPNYLQQDGTIEGGNGLRSRIYLVGTSEYKEDGNYSVDMKLPYAVLKLDVSALGTSGAMTIAANGATVASVTDVASSEGKAVFVAVPTDETEKAYTITCGGKIATKTWTLKKNVFYTKADAGGAGTGGAVVITPMFTIDGDGTMVEFAPGNLYWDGSAFRFEANQWSTTPASDGTCDESHVSHFFWSKDARVGYAANYNGANSQYGITPTTDDVFFTNSKETTANPNFTVNGETGTWRTLSIAEWGYLLGTATPCRDNASSLRAWKDFGNNVKGLVILPDGTDASVMSSISSTSDLAKYGAVFLPAAGYRDGADVVVVGSLGSYWSSTPDEDTVGYALGMYFVSDNVVTTLGGRNTGYAVRLVR